MPAFVIGTLELTDPAPMDEYGQKVGPVIEQFGGRIHIMGPVTVLEGDANPTLAAVIEFATKDDAARWYDSEDYGAIRGLRQSSGRTTVLLVDGSPT